MDGKCKGAYVRCALKICIGAVALSTFSAKATMLEFRQTGVLDNPTNDVLTVTALFQSDDVLSSAFTQYTAGGEIANYMAPSFTVSLMNVTLDLGGTTLASTAGGTFSFGGDLNVPAAYDAFWSFDFAGWSWSVIDGLAASGVSAAEFGTWDDPVTDFLTSRDFQANEYRLRGPDGTSTRLVRSSGDFQIREVPEPATFGLLAFGLWGTLLARRRTASMR